jgi:DNA polymerase (family 10)
MASTVIREARRAAVDIEALTAVGDVRRYEPAVTAITVLGIAHEARHTDLCQAFSSLPGILGVEWLDAHSVRMRMERGHITLRLTTADQFGTALVWHTGSTAHVDCLSARARDRCLTFDHGRLLSSDGGLVACASEDDLYRALDLPFIPPELRAGHDEIVEAGRRALPALVSQSQVRGDLHTHTTWSDGHDTTARMVQAAVRLGYEYVAITDHSPRAGASRTLSVEDVPRQRAEIAALRAVHPGIDILHGIEVDILPSGDLDLEDDLLAGFDIVLASLHADAGQDRAELTARYLRAVHHSLVNVITHPANRSPARSPGFDIDFDALFAAAAATGTAVEIDGAPAHLDLDGTLARRAAAAGATLVIDSDCHRADWLARQMRFGVGTARRGWIEARHVLNTFPAADVRAFVEHKRQRG